MADPTANAYARVNYYGTTRPDTAVALAIPGFDDITPNVDYQNKFPIWTIVRDCYDGELTIKAGGEKYLPKLSAHNTEDYKTYKARSYFYNGVRRTHRGLHGSMFRKPVEITLPAAMKSKINLNNITQDTQSFQSFCKVMGHELLLTGRFGIIADFKTNRPDSPYLAGYIAENIYSWRTREHEDREIVDRVTLLENETINTEFGQTTRMVIRILRLDADPDRPGKLIYSQTEIRPDAGASDIDPVRRDIPVNIRGRTLDYIPFVFVNATGTSTTIGPAPLEDIAAINISHYQSTAHLEHGRFYAGMPTYYTAGGDENSANLPDGMMKPDPMTVGPSFLWELPMGAKAGLLEFTGHGLTFLENAVDSKQLQMQSLGGRLISSTRRAAAMSDEAWQLLETGDEATLMDIAVTSDEAMSKAMTFLGDIMGEIDDITKSGVTVEFNKEFVRSELTARELRAIQALRERGHIPEDVMYYALRDVGVVPVEYTLDDFKTLLAREDQKYQPPPLPGTPGGPALPPNPNNPAPSGGTPGTRNQPAPRPANSGTEDD